MTRSSMEWYEAALELRQAGKLNEAIAAARAAVSEGEDRAEPLHVLGAMLLQAGDSDGAIAPLSRAKAAYHARTAARHESTEAWFQLACDHALLREDADAIAALKRAFTLDNGFHAHELRSRAREDEDLARLLDGGDALERLVPELPDADERARLYAIFEAARVVFERVEGFEYYLANAIGSSFLLPSANVAEAQRRMTSPDRVPRPVRWSGPPVDEAEAARRRHAEAVAARIEREKREGKASLDEVFAAYFMDLVRDDAGNVVDIAGQDGDVSAVPLLEEIAELVRDGSWFLYLDDLGRYWRASIRSSRLLYERGRPAAP